MTGTKRLSLHGRLRMAAACPDPNAALLAEAADAIEQHEAFRQEVSDAVSGFFADDGFDRTGLLRRFIIAEPVDPLVEVLADMGLKPKGGYDWASEFRNTLAKRNGKIVWENSDA